MINKQLPKISAVLFHILMLLASLLVASSSSVSCKAIGGTPPDFFDQHCNQHWHLVT